MSFRKKIALGHLLLFVGFILVSLPFIHKAVSNIVFNNLLKSSRSLIGLLQTSQDENRMILKIEDSKGYLFFRVSLFDEQGKVLYDSTLGDKAKEKKISLMSMTQQEVSEILKNKIYFSTSMPDPLKAKLTYCSQTFGFLGKTYILRSAIPQSQVKNFTEEFRVWFFSFYGAALLFVGTGLWLLFRRSNDEQGEKKAILESLGEGVIIVDKEMIVRYINCIGSKMLAVPQRLCFGKALAEIGSSSSSTLMTKCFFLLKSCQSKAIALTDSILIEEKRKLYLDLIATPIEHSSGAILVLQDKSSHHKVLEMGKDFVANASHELRTPITIIKGFAETLQDLPELPRDMVVDITEKIVRNCQRMDNLVKNLLTLADLENLPDARFRECDLIEMAEVCKEVVSAIYPDAKIVIEKVHEPILIAADPDILELAINNLLDNAAKYSNPPAQIVIKLDQVKDEVILSISDRGIGIAPADLEQIFERFYTVDKARSRRFGGAGLGLSIVRTIIEKHHGAISVASIEGQGTTFTARLPANI